MRIGGAIHPLTTIPRDIELEGIRGRLLHLYDDLDSRSKEDHHALTNNELLRHILKNTDIDILLRTLGNAFTPRSVDVLTTRTELIRANRYPRGYILLNPAPSLTSGVTSSITVFPSALRVPGTYLSANITTSNFLSARAFLDVTVQAAGATLLVDLQTRDPDTLNFATAQADIFAGSAAVGTYYANLGQTGVDLIARFRAVVGVNNLTFSMSVILKEGVPVEGTVPSSTIFLGPRDLNTATGYPLLPGQKETFFLKENTPLFGIVTAPGPVTIRVFELQ